MKYKYKYLVSFAHQSGQASSVITYSSKIKNEEDLIFIKKYIEIQNKFESVVITNFILMDKEWGVWDWFVAIVELLLLVFCIFSMIASIFG